jgi:hypothetical protein
LEEHTISTSITELIRSGAAPRAAKMAAAKGMLPISREEMLGLLVGLLSDEDEAIRSASTATLQTVEPASFLDIAEDESTSAELLGFLCLWPRAPRELLEAAVFNRSTPDGALIHLAGHTSDRTIIDAISLKQQSLIRAPEIIEAVLANPARSLEAERRVREVREEFFQKEFGAKLVADEQKARAGSATTTDTITIGGIEDLIRLGLIEEGIDDQFISEYETEYGPFPDSSPQLAEQIEIQQLVGDIIEQDIEMAPERLPVFQQIALMSVKDRIMLAIKGTREARMILVRDPNRLVAGAVLRNPRLTDGEIEYMASIKNLPEDVLRQIGVNRAWAKSYVVIHNLVRNPRTPVPTSLGFLNRIQTKDLRLLSLNKNIPDVIRTSASRLFIKRTHG